MTTSADMTRAIGAIDDAVGDPSKTKRKKTPAHIIKALGEFTATTHPFEQKVIEDLVHELTLHAATLSMDAFKFSLMEIDWPTPKDTSLNTVYSAIKRRNLCTKALAKDGIALGIFFDSEKQEISVNAEDLKGRHHLLMKAPLKSPLVKANLGSGSDAQDYGILSPKSWASTKADIVGKSPYPDFVADALVSAIDRLVMVDIFPFNIDNHRHLWYCGKDGVTSVHKPLNGLFPIPLNSASVNLHAQLNKVDKTLIPKLANAARIGPTQKTMVALFEPLLSQKALSTPEALKQALHTAVVEKKSKAFTTSQLAQHIPSHLVEQQLSASIRARQLADLCVAEGKMFNPNPKSVKQHASIPLIDISDATEPQTPETPAREHTQKAKAETKPTPKTTEDPTVADKMQRILLNSSAQSTLLTVAGEMVDCMHPDGVDIKPDDIQALCTLIELAQKYPQLAEHSVAMFSGIIREKGRALPPPSLEHTARQEHRATPRPQ